MRLRISCIPIAVLLIAPAAASADFAHVVAPGESLYSVAATDGLSVADLAAANGLAPSAELVSGSTLMIPAAGSSTSTGSSAAASSASGETSGEPAGDDGAGVAAATSAGSYVVRPGDTLSSIAARAGTTVAELAVANGLSPSGILPAGAVLRVSGLGSSAGTSGPSASSATSQPVGVSAAGSVSDPPYPTPEHVSASQVGAIASANGVPAALADAVGWQESGFNNDLVSGADARGVMQILPGTWNWIQSSLNAGPPLASASASDNVRGGVLLLRSLLNSTGGDSAMAAAGYYQGLPSVRANGVYRSTQQYVNNIQALERRFGGF